MQTVLIDVDTQFDFMHEDGSLFVPAEPAVGTAIRNALQSASARGVPILGSVDSHAHDAWEFDRNGGPFPVHCIKGRPGWLRVHHDLPERSRFIPMQEANQSSVRTLVGENAADAGNRVLTADDLVAEAIAGVGIYFEKEVYSLFGNPVAAPVVESLVAHLGGRDQVRFDVIGYCTGGYCVDAAARGLVERGYRVRVLGFATAAIGGAAGDEKSRAELTAHGIEWLETPDPPTARGDTAPRPRETPPRETQPRKTLP